MSTRSAYRIIDERGAVTELYRHYDGYPAFGGADFLEQVQRASTAGAALMGLLGVIEAGRPAYRPEDCWNNGDLEWRYRARLCRRGGVDGPTTWHWTYSAWQRADAWDERRWESVIEDASAGEFLRIVNLDRAAIRQRMEARKLGDPSEVPDLVIPGVVMPEIVREQVSP